MKKMMMVGLLLTVAMALQAQLKVAPKMEKGTVKNYICVVNASLPGQGDVKITNETKYTVTDVTADGYIIDIVDVGVQSECDDNNIAGKLMGAAQEIMKGTVIRVAVDKNGRVQKILNADELTPKLEKMGDELVDKMMKDIPQLAQMVSKDALKQQISQAATADAILATFQEVSSPLVLNGKTIMTGAQEDVVTKEGLKMKRMYFVNGQNITTNSTLSMTKDELKALIIKQVEQAAPEQAKMVKDNIDQLMDSGMLKMDQKETTTYELQSDGWVKSIKGESTTETMGQKVTTTSSVTMK